MVDTSDVLERRTTTDVVFESLREDIVSLKLLPGTKLSEVDVARSFDVSRQPVRDAFNRLAALDLLLIRPQKATKVRGFSAERIAHARFVRMAIELEVVRRACEVWDDRKAEILEQNLVAQQELVDTGPPEAFHALDREFHSLVCELGGCPLAAKTIEECKQKVDRMCMLSLSRGHEAETLLGDHRTLADALMRSSVEDSSEITRLHMRRLDDTIFEIQRTHAEYFE